MLDGLVLSFQCSRAEPDLFRQMCQRGDSVIDRLCKIAHDVTGDWYAPFATWVTAVAVVSRSFENQRALCRKQGQCLVAGRDGVFESGVAHPIWSARVGWLDGCRPWRSFSGPR